MDIALYKYFQALEYFSASGDIKMQITVLSDIGTTYLELNDIEKSLVYFEQGELLAKKLSTDLSIGFFYGNLGNAYKRNKEFDKAFTAFQTALDIAIQLKDTQMEAKSLHNLGDLKRYNEEYDEALDLFNRSLEICKNLNLDYGIMMNFVSKEKYQSQEKLLSLLLLVSKALAEHTRCFFRCYKRRFLWNQNYI